jgi:Na+/melibiose symporter-like transporter
MLLPDIAEMGRFRTGTDHTAMVWASYGFANKFGTSVVASLSLLILAAYGFVSVEADGFEELAEQKAQGVALQTDRAIQGLWDVSHLYPTIGLAITCVFFFFVKVRRHEVAAMAAANSARANAART